MIGQNKKRITLTLPDITVDMLEVIAKDTGLTKSKIMKQLLFNYTLNFWSAPDEEIQKWKGIKDNEKK